MKSVCQIELSNAAVAGLAALPRNCVCTSVHLTFESSLIWVCLDEPPYITCATEVYDLPRNCMTCLG
jgi:hypothetical protein